MFGYSVNLKERNDVWNGYGQSLPYVLVLVCVFLAICPVLSVPFFLWWAFSGFLSFPLFLCHFHCFSLYFFPLLTSIRTESFLLLFCFWTYDRNKVLQASSGYTGLYMDTVDKM
jgi:hypothetical protein